MGQRCVHYTERDNGTRVLYAPNQCQLLHITPEHTETMSSADSHTIQS